MATHKDKYWEDFYSKNHTMEASPFAQDTLRELIVLNPSIRSMVDLMAGNGRDTKFFKESLHGLKIDGIDRAIGNDYVKQMSFNDLTKRDCEYDLVYCRFGIHLLSTTEVERLVWWTKKYIALEWRAPGDVPELYPEESGHRRIYHSPQLLIKYLTQNGYHSIQVKYGKGLAQYKGEDPLICRIYAER